jgi:hypothetical protein
MENLDFIYQAILGILIPENSNGDVGELFTSANIQRQPLFQESSISSLIAQRKILYFGKSVIRDLQYIDLTHFRELLDELLPIYVVFQIQCQDEVQLRSYIPRLAINIEVHAYSSSRQEASRDQSPSQKRDIIWSIEIDTAKDPSIFTLKNEFQNDGSWSYIVWKAHAPLSG